MANIAKKVVLKFTTSMLLCALMFTSACLCQSVPGIYMLGDSLVDVGNNNHLPLSLAKANFAHNGLDFPSGKATGRFSNGKNAADFLAEKVGLPTGPPYLSLLSKEQELGDAPITGVSFASGGAGIIRDTPNQSISLTQQVEHYSLVYEQLVQKLGSAGAQTHLAKSLFMIVIGSNDLFAYFKNNSDPSKKYTPQQYVDLIASNLIHLMKRLHGMGARKFVVTGLGMIGCCPRQRKDNATSGCNEEANYWSSKYNDGLKHLLENLKLESPDINYSYFDMYKAMSDLIQDPQKYGITEIKEACCGIGNLKADVPCIPVSNYCPNRNNHLFWDFYHPTEMVSNLNIDLMYNGPKQYTLPMTIEQLVEL
ncbi:SGNH hydrolase-type esterase domain-containing protein [Artemisia annua]|uniref:SGNH hydrolase-type esterase domain-containing protein n=1 Tax=Artemisia annua TaxID=35608 RepID=A0A2U1PWR7_ARTAN|nr:SGNH hydrolase-type esterase domain-containing protein [Artemisia annua]